MSFALIELRIYSIFQTTKAIFSFKLMKTDIMMAMVLLILLIFEETLTNYVSKNFPYLTLGDLPLKFCLLNIWGIKKYGRNFCVAQILENKRKLDSNFVSVL